MKKIYTYSKEYLTNKVKFLYKNNDFHYDKIKDIYINMLNHIMYFINGSIYGGIDESDNEKFDYFMYHLKNFDKILETINFDSDVNTIKEWYKFGNVSDLFVEFVFNNIGLKNLNINLKFEKNWLKKIINQILVLKQKIKTNDLIDFRILKMYSDNDYLDHLITFDEKAINNFAKQCGNNKIQNNVSYIQQFYIKK